MLLTQFFYLKTRISAEFVVQGEYILGFASGGFGYSSGWGATA